MEVQVLLGDTEVLEEGAEQPGGRNTSDEEVSLCHFPRDKGSSNHETSGD